MPLSLSVQTKTMVESLIFKTFSYSSLVDEEKSIGSPLGRLFDWVSGFLSRWAPLDFFYFCILESILIIHEDITIRCLFCLFLFRLLLFIMWRFLLPNQMSFLFEISIEKTQKKKIDETFFNVFVAVEISFFSYI